MDSAFVAELSHELRTAVVNLVGYSDMLLGSATSPCSPEEMCQGIQANSRHLLELLDSLLDVSMDQAGRLPNEAEPFSPQRLVLDVFESFRVQAEAKGLRLELDIAEAIPRQMRADKIRIRRVLFNLVSNAIKYSDTGVVKLAVAFRPSKPGGDCGEERLIFKVRDEGVGIAPEDISRIYQPFFRGSSLPQKAVSGSGLGLLITKQLVEALGGSLAVSSLVGIGSTFEVTVPVAAQSVEKTAPAATKEPAKMPAGSKILLIDNDPDVQKLLKLRLQSHRIEVEVSSDGWSALARPHHDFDAILLDLQMPKLDGEATARRLRERGYTGPIIALSAGRSPSAAALTRAGLTAFLSKVASIEEVLAVCKAHISVAKKTTAGAAAQAERTRSADERNALSRDSAARPSLGRGPAGIAPGAFDTYSADPRLRVLQRNYVASLTGIVEELQQAVDAGDAELLKRVAHRTIGACGMFGFSDLAEIAEMLQDATVKREPAHLLEQHVAEMQRRVTGMQRRLATAADQRAKPR